MAERVPPSDKNPEPSPDEDPDAELHSARLRSGNYIVQFPKDQIYRVPPPENAQFAERYRNPSPRTCSCCCLSLKCIFVGLLIVAILVAIGIALFFILVRPHPATFHINRIAAKTPDSLTHHHQYHITLRVQNPNAQLGILYNKGGSAALSYKGLKIATGKPNSFYQPNRNSTSYPLLLAGSDIGLPRQGSKASIPLSLSLIVPVRIRLGAMWLWGKNMEVGCNLTVNKLTEGTRVISQECHSKIK